MSGLGAWQTAMLIYKEGAARVMKEGSELEHWDVVCSIQCDECDSYVEARGEADDALRQARGWRNVDGKVLCDDCLERKGSNV